jgi:hypothetical protein
MMETPTVFRPQGREWSFGLPEQHTYEVDEPAGFVHLGTPGAATTFRLDHIEDGDERVVFFGEPLMWSGPPAWMAEGGPPALGYPVPELTAERDRLRALCDAAGFPPEVFNARVKHGGRDETDEAHLRRVRRVLRAA